MLPEIGLAKGACTLWQEDLLLDYTIEVEDEQFKVHKLVMASVSDYFKAMLTGGMKESREDRVRLEGLSSLAVKDLIEFIYTGQFGSSNASTEERLACAVYLQIPAAVELCTASLCEEVNKENCFHILYFFKTYAIEDGIQHSVRFIKQNIDAIVDEEMPYDEFVILMDLWEKSEWDLYIFAKRWLQADRKRVNDHINDIMTRIRYCLMSPAELKNIKDVYIFSDSDKPWHDLVKKALIYHSLPTHQKVLDESMQAKVRSDPTPVWFGVPPNLPGILYSLYKEKSWIRQDAIKPPNLDKRPLPFVEINNFVIVFDYKDEAECFIFDPRTLSWSTMASMEAPRDLPALVYHDKYLYALGGISMRGQCNEETDVIEKYDFQTDSWSTVNSKTLVASFGSHAVSIAGCIYILGGFIDDPDTRVRFSDRLDCFDPHTGQWEEKATRPGLYSEVVILELNGEEVLVAFDHGSILNYYTPSINQWSKFVMPRSLGVDRQSRLLTNGNSIYILGFSSVTGEGEGVNKTTKYCEKWVLNRNRLEIQASLDEFPFDLYINFCVMLSLPSAS